MFASFFYLLRARGLKISLNEWITFIEAIDKGLSEASFTQFYYLARSLLIKSEVEYDKFDCVFLEYFKNMEFDSEALSQDLMTWLNNPKYRKHNNLGLSEWTRGLSGEKIRKMFKERLEEQKEEHNGGTYWIGTGGTSPFGNSGKSLNGIRVGGSSQHRTAISVASERRFRDFQQDTILDMRSFQVAFRSLRQFSSRTNAPRTVLNINETIQQTCNNAGHLKLAFEKPRKNIVKLMLLMDSGGSMETYSSLCASLFQAVNKSNYFKDLRIYYFHNCFNDRLYQTPHIFYSNSVGVDWVLQNIDSEYKVIIVGDALMSTWELTDTPWFRDKNIPSGLQQLRMFREKYPHLVWLNPIEEAPKPNSYWGESYHIVRKEVDMHRLTIKNLTTIMKKLMVTR